jgi:hypothetical protein
MNTHNKKIELVDMFKEYVFLDTLPKQLHGVKKKRFGISFIYTGHETKACKERIVNEACATISKVQSLFEPRNHTIFSISFNGDSVNIFFREVEV